ncbi:MAG: cysteine desulfurase family protein [Rectinema sp.]|uniref:cysteine desulfurase n=1 Tax=uncultured spirochete TaxID=156406 RepID=A0A3P3XUB6_9SPIR|nr:cysteine desulfurase (tRNA sulfurtransferase), PLP-dependent [uncultured spirochete]
MNTRYVYMDYNATTPLRPEVRDLMVKSLDIYGNASSMHELGRKARAEIEGARANVAALIGTKDPSTVYFTSGGSESNNTVFNTMFLRGRNQTRHKIITTAIEHPCVLNAAAHLRDEGFPVVFLPVDRDGRIDMDAYRAELGPDVLLVSVMAANNEIGTIEDVGEIARLAKAQGAFVHTDATQAVGKIPVSVEDWNVDYLTLSCHKIYGPKGIGALYVRRKTPIEPLIRGGHQENGVRAGTYNNLGIIGFGEAARLAQEELSEYRQQVGSLRAMLRDLILERIPMVRINGPAAEVLPNTLNVSFPGAEGESILLSLDLEGIEVSTGSACASGSLDPSHVLMAIGLGPELAHGSIRFSLGKYTTEDDVRYVADRLPPIIARLRKMSTIPLEQLAQGIG